MASDERLHKLDTGRVVRKQEGGNTVAAYVLEIHDGMLQTAIPVRYLDIEVAFVGDGGADVFVGGTSPSSGEMYRYLFRIGTEGEGSVKRNYVIHNLDVSSAKWELRVISNCSTPDHLVLRLYCRSVHGQTLGVLSEHQMIKLAN